VKSDTSLLHLQGNSAAALDALLNEIAAGAAQRERERVPPFEEIRALSRAGLGALRVPREHGGQGASLRELFAFVVRLAAADSNIAQSLRAHYHFVEGRLASPDAGQRERWLPAVVGGALFGNATVERTTREIFGFETTLTPRAGGGWLLDGVKYYSTGSLYADLVSVAARLPDGSVAAAIVPVDRDGVTLEDDWDGMGQRLTASGTSRFERVLVADDELLPSPIGKESSAPRAAFLQLYLVAVMAGIAAAAATDAATVARERRRTFSHAAGELPRVDPLVQQAVGQVAVDAFAAEAAVLAAAEAMDAAEATAHDGEPDPDAVHAASLRTAQAQVLVAELAPRAASALFDAGGASATSRELDLDRHWRNARTIANHNAAMYKARAIGDLLINGERLPTNGFF
jgi:alkylation response protein AidB-like acyl-CoA dehydrogenase